jgi:acetyl esterase/lipase
MRSDYWQRLGLLVINGLARSRPTHREQVAYGDLPRHYRDWYRHPDGDHRPTVLFFYGGNWRSGRRQDYRFVADTLMTLGCDAVVPDYRLYSTPASPTSSRTPAQRRGPFSPDCRLSGA